MFKSWYFPQLEEKIKNEKISNEIKNSANLEYEALFSLPYHEQLKLSKEKIINILKNKWYFSLEENLTEKLNIDYLNEMISVKLYHESIQVGELTRGLETYIRKVSGIYYKVYQDKLSYNDILLHCEKVKYYLFFKDIGFVESSIYVPKFIFNNIKELIYKLERFNFIITPNWVNKSFVTNVNGNVWYEMSDFKKVSSSVRGDRVAIKNYIEWLIEQAEKKGDINEELKNLYLEEIDILDKCFKRLYEVRYKFLRDLHINKEMQINFKNNFETVNRDDIDRIEDSGYIITWDELFSSKELKEVNTKIGNKLNNSKYKDFRLSEFSTISDKELNSTVFDKGLNKGRENISNLALENFPWLNEKRK